MNAREGTEQSIQLLARSAFVLVVSLTLATTVCLPLFVLSQTPADLKADAPVVISIGLVVIVGLVAFCIYFWRTDPAQLLAPTRRLVGVLKRRWFAWLIAVGALESALLSLAIVNRINSPAIWLVFLWMIIGCEAWVILVIVHWRALSRSVERARALWISAGVTFMALIVWATLSFVNARLSAALATPTETTSHPLWIFGPGHEDEAAAYWADASPNVPLQWTPYVYWRRPQISSQDVTVDADGLRKTASFVSTGTPAIQKIFFFGGSTVWGTGARDDFTIPSDVARILNSENLPADVTNFGETGYVSTQDMILFQMQLARGNVPNTVVFYQGYNDVFAAWQENVAGLPQNEPDRAKDFMMGRALAASADVIDTVGALYTVAPLPHSPLITSPYTAQAIVDRYLANVRLVQAMAAAYNVKVIFIWQPSLFFKQPFSDWEKSAYQLTQQQYPGLETLCRQVDTEIRKREANSQGQGVILMTDVFQGDSRNLFIDSIHITEEGNFTVSQRIATILMQQGTGQ